MTAFLATMAMMVVAASPAASGEAPRVLAPLKVPTVPAPGGAGCAACHVETSWSAVRFDHERTGFPLVEAHARVGCRGCHVRDFRRRVPDTCSGCHRDRHGGQLGLHCEGCHDAKTWRNPLFGSAGHQLTSFPLTGKHAELPCRECHGDMRDRAFTRAPLSCVDCHRGDYEGTRGRTVDHAAARFDTRCQTCHTTWRFSPARFESHDLCFVIGAGPHRSVRCSDCHASASGLTASGACATGNSRCVGCHSHDCAKSDQQHQNVMGYSCIDRKCYECHQRTAP